MKRITIPMENLKAIVVDHVYEGFGPFVMLFGETTPDIRVYIDEVGAQGLGDKGKVLAFRGLSDELQAKARELMA